MSTTQFDNSPNSSATNAVAGTSITPYNAGERRAFHYIEHIYDPDKHPIEERDRYVVPQEGELVFDQPNGLILVVEKVDWEATLKSTLSPWALQNGNAGNTADQDALFGLRGGPMAGEALLAIDFSVRPPVARIDATIMRPDAAYALLFYGNNLDKDTGKIISAQYNAGQTMISKQVPCKLAAIKDLNNQTIMTTGPFSVTMNKEALPDGSRCTVVFYDQGGNFIPPVQMLMVQDCAYMKDHEIGMKYVTEIELISPWFSNTSDPTNIMVPINVPLLAVELRAVAHFSDGSKTDALPVNGTKFSLYGLREWRPKAPGQVGELSLNYNFADNEQHYIAQPGSPNHKAQIYTITAGSVKGAYSPKIYTYPQWDATIGGYKLQHFLFDLDRKTLIDVTDIVTLNDKSPAFRPTTYGVAQNMIFNLNLKNVAQTYESVTYVQYTEIILSKNVNGPGTRWTVGFDAAKAAYDALTVKAVNNGTSTTFNLSNSLANQAAWLDALYWKVNPSYDTYDEDKAPNPTHFDFMHEDGRRWRFAIADWNKNNPINIELQKGKTWYINWVNKAANGTELQLATTGVTVEV